MNTQSQTNIITTERTVTLQPITMVVLNREDVYEPNRLKQAKAISEQEFLDKFADNPHTIKVSFEPDGKSKWQLVTAYGRGMDCWYIVTEVEE